MFIGIVINDFFLTLRQDRRVQVLEEIIEPRITSDGDPMSRPLTVADIDREMIGLVADYSTQMVLREFGKTSTNDKQVPGVDAMSAQGLKSLIKKQIQQSYERFEPKNMTARLETFLRKLLEIVMN